MAYGMIDNLLFLAVIGYRNEKGMKLKLKQKAKLKWESKIIANYTVASDIFIDQAVKSRSHSGYALLIVAQMLW